MNWRRHLQALLEDHLLALNAHDLGPSDESVKVLLRREGAADPELLRPLFEEWVDHFLNLLLGGDRKLSALLWSLKIKIVRLTEMDVMINGERESNFVYHFSAAAASSSSTK